MSEESNVSVISSSEVETKTVVKDEGNKKKDKYPTYITRANKRDIDQIYNLVNAAYNVEKGDSGLGFKNCDKFTLKDHCRKKLDDMLVLRDHIRVKINYFYLYMCTSKDPREGVKIFLQGGR